MELNTAELPLSPYKKELKNVLGELEECAKAEPQIEPYLDPIRRSINLRMKNPRHRVSSPEFVGMSERMNVIFYACEDFQNFKDNPHELKLLKKKLEDINGI